MLKKNSIAFGSAPRREADSQPISQASSPSDSLSGKQAGRQKHTVSVFCQWQTWLHAVGRTHSVRISHSRMVMKPTAKAQVGGSHPLPMPAVSANMPARNRTGGLPISGRLHYHLTGACSDSNCSPHRLKPSDQKLLTPPPPQQSVIQFQGIEASESKNPLGGGLIGQNNDFIRGWTSNIMPWGMRRE